MKSFLQNTALVGGIVLLVSCGGDDSSSTGDVTPPEDPPVSGVEGQVIKGPVVGASISVLDATRNDVALNRAVVTTDGTGSYSARFTVVEIEAGIDIPIIVNAEGGDIVCDYNMNDMGCPVSEGVYVAVGETFPMPADLILSGWSPVLASGNEEAVDANINIATDMAVGLAENEADVAGGPLTDQMFADAVGRVLGLVQIVTGTNLSGVDLRTVTLPDLSSIASVELNDQSLALALFGSSFIGQVDAADPDSNLLQVLNTNFESLSINASGNLQTTGAVLAKMASSISTGVAGLKAQYTAAGKDVPDILTNIEFNAAGSSELFALSGDNPITISAPAVPGSGEPLDQTKEFVATLSSVIDAALVTTGAENFGGTQKGVTEVFADELDAVGQLSSGVATKAFSQILDAIDTASSLTAGGSIAMSGDVTGTLSRSEDGLTDSLADVISTAAEGDIEVTITIPTGSHFENGTSASLTGIGIHMTTSQAGALLQTFHGDISMSFVEENDDLGLNAATFDGSITTEAAEGTFAVNADLSNITGTTEQNIGTKDVEADYTATFSFADLVISMNGKIYENNQSFAVTAGGNTIWGTVSREGDIDTDTLTDMTTTLTLILDLSENGELVSGNFTVAGEETATMDDQGIVYYSDGSIQSLPAAIF
jgi:hypothetical protein